MVRSIVFLEGVGGTSFEELEKEVEDVGVSRGRMVSRFQFARPAVEFSLFDQIILTPPVGAVNLAMLPDAVLSSSSLRKSSATVCFEALKSFLRCTSALSFLYSDFRGLFVGDFRGEVDGEKSDSSESQTGKGKDRPVFDGLRGEWTSCQLLIIAELQNASILGLCGVGGILFFVFVGDLSLDFEGLVGGVTGRWEPLNL